MVIKTIFAAMTKVDDGSSGGDVGGGNDYDVGGYDYDRGSGD